MNESRRSIKWLIESEECKVKSIDQTHLRSLRLCTLHFALCTRHSALCCGFAALPSDSVELREKPAQWLLCLLLCLLFCMLSGCGQKDGTLAEVSGDITFCGQPAVAEILFEPLNTAGTSTGRASTATSDESGRFRLMLDESRPGAKIGRNRVAIRVQRLSPSNNAAAKSDNSPEGVIGTLKATKLVREVHAGDNQFHFRLTH